MDPDVVRDRVLARKATEKCCTTCGVTSPVENFSLVRTGKYGPIHKSTCKPCQATAARKWFHENKERAKESKHAWTLRTTYGITPEQYQEMLAAQNGVCSICKQVEPTEHGRTGTQFRLAVDHCHDTGRVRGLLCQRCNRAIGLLGDSVDLLREAINYLEKK